VPEITACCAESGLGARVDEEEKVEGRVSWTGRSCDSSWALRSRIAATLLAVGVGSDSVSEDHTDEVEGA
jgi:hypothetical protein